MEQEDLDAILQLIEQVPTCDSLDSLRTSLVGAMTEQLLYLDKQILVLAKLTNPASLISTLITMFTKELSDAELEKIKLIDTSAKIVQALSDKALDLNCK